MMALRPSPTSLGEAPLTARALIYPAFIVSGVAGLVYEALWSRYLGLYVGHSAYAQVLVLAVYLGGMAVGALAIGERSKRLAEPLLWYARVEVLLGLLGIVFHGVFLGMVDLSYDHVFPALGSAGLVGAVRWGLAGAVIMPQAVLLGTTFPLMAAGLVRADAGRPGRGVATVYLLNTLGGAAGVLIAGFWWIGSFGFAGTSMAAAALNMTAAALVWIVVRREREQRSSIQVAGSGAPDEPVADAAAVADAPSHAVGDARPWAGPHLLPIMLAVSFATALASFAYEIGWIRMLSLVLGSATHSFELMLSAFILGLALGAWWIRSRADGDGDPRRLLGVIQVAMGLAALATLPVYLATFGVMAVMVEGYTASASGYLAFNLGRYAICLAVMLPATVLAGMTLPVITGMLIRAGEGEESIGRVYGVNTIGSVAGAGLAGLVGLPLLGLEGLLVAGAALDMALGVWLLGLAWQPAPRSGLRTAALAGACALLLGLVSSYVNLDRATLTSGVYRYARVADEGMVQSLYYKDGRTATISVHQDREEGMLVISTNGKPDASVGSRWYVEGRDTLPPTAVEPARDYMTQVLAPLVGLAHHAGARSVANVGHGSGMTGTALLTSPALERLVNIEIEPAMVEGSFVFYPVNQAVFDDPRSTFVFDDAKSFFAYSQEQFDLIFLEPSNPWVSGVASLFTEEFYLRSRDFLADDGVLVQWMQMYESNDDLFLTVLAALDRAFDSYRVYRVGDMDLAIVAAKSGELRPADWSVVATDGVRQLMLGAPPLEPEIMPAIEMFDQSTFRTILDAGAPANSDYRPILDAGAERARLALTSAEGVHSFSANRLDLHKVIAEEVQAPVPFRLPPSRGVRPFVDWGRAAWMRDALAAGGAAPPIQFLTWTDALVNVRNFLLEIRQLPPQKSWMDIASSFERVERELNWGTTGWVNETLYEPMFDFLDQHEAPPEARAAVDFHYGLATFDWERVAAASDLLVSRVAAGERWVRATVLIDAAVVAYLKVGRPTAAQTAFRVLAPRSGREGGHLRNRLLESLIEDALAQS